MRYNKLVRDNIIKIIEKKGGKAKWHIAGDNEYHAKLKEKILEEVKEFIKTENVEEMADIFEVISAFLKLKGWSFEGVIAVQKKKHEERGGFGKKIILEES